MGNETERPDDAILLMYNALMAIGCIGRELHSAEWCFARAQEIANHAIKRMNCEHTKAVQKALGIGD